MPPARFPARVLLMTIKAACEAPASYLTVFDPAMAREPSNLPVPPTSSVALGRKGVVRPVALTPSEPAAVTTMPLPLVRNSRLPTRDPFADPGSWRSQERPPTEVFVIVYAVIFVL